MKKDATGYTSVPHRIGCLYHMFHTLDHLGWTRFLLSAHLETRRVTIVDSALHKRKDEPQKASMSSDETCKHCRRVHLQLWLAQVRVCVIAAGLTDMAGRDRV